MQAGLLPQPIAPAVESSTADADLLITMLDGGLGAVAASSETVMSDAARPLCFCDCIICGAGSLGLTAEGSTSEA